MNKVKRLWNRLRLPLLFALVVLNILIITMLLVVGGVYLLAALNIIEDTGIGHVPILIFAVVSVLVGTALAAIASRIPLKPVQRIMDAIDAIADGDYSTRLDLGGIEEFRTLSTKFNHMAQELESVEMLRSDFVNNFSHEFKTPIVSIRGFAKAMKWDGLTPEERDEYLDIIISESERLAELSSNVLYLSKLEKQTILTDKQAFNLTEQLRLVIALLHSRMAEKGLEPVFTGGEYYVKGNAEMLKQVWINLLDNAIKFSPESGIIKITLSADEGTLVCEIANSAPAIPQEKAGHIFEKFYQADASHSTKGNGLGLPMVQKILQLHGGTICLKRSDEKETVFSVRLPALQDGESGI